MRQNLDELVAGYLYDTDGKHKPYLFHQDQLTSTTAVTGHNGGTIQSTRYGAFGNIISNTGTTPNRQTYTGREDDKTGLMYYRARYYDPAIGRFISEDPMGFGAGDVNFYQYTSNNPVNGNDPSGLDAFSAIAKLGGRLGNAATREHIAQVAKAWIDDGWKLVSGGGRAEEFIAPIGGGRAGGAYGDIVLKNPATGQTKIINTVDTYADGITATSREVAAGNKIQNLRPDAEFMMIPKPKAGQTAAAVAAGLGAGGAQAADRGILGTGISWGDVGEFLLDMVVPPGVIGSTGGCSSGRCSDMVDWSKMGSTSSYAPAGGGFLLYPNRSNTNMSTSVYSK